MGKILIPKEEAIEFAYGNFICDRIIETTRWDEIHEMVFEYNGKYYTTSYTEGLTEMQPNGPFEDEGDEIECWEVELQKVTVEKWVII